QERCFLHLEAPVQRVCGYDTPFPLVSSMLSAPPWSTNERSSMNAAFAFCCGVRRLLVHGRCEAKRRMGSALQLGR
ncbi:unnamed protein product, partial [Hapterophycus canaliculatus]